MAKAKAKKEAVNPDLLDVIISPVVTEKSTLAGAAGKYTFKVSCCSDKTKIKQAIETVFGVNVTKINVVNYDGKSKVFRGRQGQRNAFRKAIVTLKSGQSIDLSSGIKI